MTERRRGGPRKEPALRKGGRQFATDVVDIAESNAWDNVGNQPTLWDAFAEAYRLPRQKSMFTRFERRDGVLVPVHADPDVQNRRDRITGWMHTLSLVKDIAVSDAKGGKLSAVIRAIRQTAQRNREMKESGHYHDWSSMTVDRIWRLRPKTSKTGLQDRASFHDWKAISEEEKLPPGEPGGVLVDFKDHVKGLGIYVIGKGVEKGAAAVHTGIDKGKTAVHNGREAVATTVATGAASTGEKVKNAFTGWRSRKDTQQQKLHQGLHNPNRPQVALHPVLGTPLNGAEHNGNGQSRVVPPTPDAPSQPTSPAPDVQQPQPVTAGDPGRYSAAELASHYGGYTTDGHNGNGSAPYVPDQQPDSGPYNQNLIGVPAGMTSEEATWLINNGYVQGGQVYRPGELQSELLERYGLDPGQSPEPPQPEQPTKKPIVIDMPEE